MKWVDGNLEYLGENECSEGKRNKNDWTDKERFLESVKYHFYAALSLVEDPNTEKWYLIPYELADNDISPGV